MAKTCSEKGNVAIVVNNMHKFKDCNTKISTFPNRRNNVYWRKAYPGNDGEKVLKEMIKLNGEKGSEKRTVKTTGKVLLAVIGAVIIVLAVRLLYVYNYIPHKMYTNEDFGLQPYTSSEDRDGDGVDDQTDILEGVRAYIGTRPKYKSKYYNTGYPDDGYGVCTDVVAFGLKAAGYDLMQLVDEDIADDGADYDVDLPDSNIDFRRVKNLKVYFAHTATALTTDIYDIGEWQGGDIVIFENHIGSVSDHRNKDGVAFVIHHAHPWQRSYEEDILEQRDDIVGHYRIK